MANEIYQRTTVTGKAMMYGTRFVKLRKREMFPKYPHINEVRLVPYTKRGSLMSRPSSGAREVPSAAYKRVRQNDTRAAMEKTFAAGAIAEASKLPSVNDS